MADKDTETRLVQVQLSKQQVELLERLASSAPKHLSMPEAVIACIDFQDKLSVYTKDPDFIVGKKTDEGRIVAHLPLNDLVKTLR